MSMQAITNLNLCYDSLDELLGALSDEQWATQSYCPDWDVRGVATHLAAVEAMMTGEEPGSFSESIPFERIAEWDQAASGLDNVDLLAKYREAIAVRRTEMAGYEQEHMEQPSLTPVGPKTYGDFLNIRVFDFWVHEQDIRGPLAIAGHEDGPAAEMAIDQIEGSLPYIVGKKIGLKDTMSITFDLTGPVERTMHVRVDGRAGNVDSLDGPADVTVTANSTAFALLACGRIDPQGSIDDASISWSGDDSLGEKAARNLRFTM